MEQQFVGLDVSQAETAVCVVDAAGATLWRGKCVSTPEAIAATVRRRAPQAARIALETGLLSAWHWRGLSAMGLPVVCIDARHAKAALAMQVNKTDANDALGLAQIVRTGWYREVRVKSEAGHRTRSLLAARAKLVGMRKEVSHQLRGLLQTFGRSGAGMKPRNTGSLHSTVAFFWRTETSSVPCRTKPREDIDASSAFGRQCRSEPDVVCPDEHLLARAFDFPN
jgi:transposase